MNTAVYICLLTIYFAFSGIMLLINGWYVIGVMQILLGIGSIKLILQYIKMKEFERRGDEIARRFQRRSR